ncbi:hypothetical protein, partial [Frankia nepalensis]|uniref:hypothetical protein n=1 Tax=Frankia nepalensis TaxID=1836974 RepID=UPI001EE476B7
PTCSRASRSASRHRHDQWYDHPLGASPLGDMCRAGRPHHPTGAGHAEVEHILGPLTATSP